MANAFRIDKSKFNAEQLAKYEELVAIGKADVDPEAAEEEVEDEKPPVPPKKTKKAEEKEVEDTKKSAREAQEVAPEIKKALEEVAELKKSMEMSQMAQVAKKYAPLGKKEDELAKTLYDMKKSNEANYNAYVAILDEQLALVEKSGIFAEIGKSAGGHNAGSTVESKIGAKAAEIMKADPSIDYNTAVCKAWEQSPDLLAEYDEAYHQ